MMLRPPTSRRVLVIMVLLGALATACILSLSQRLARSTRHRPRRLHSSGRSHASLPYSPPILHPQLSHCIRDEALRARTYLDTQFSRGEAGWVGGLFCNHCHHELLRQWGVLARREPAHHPAVVFDIGANVGSLAFSMLESFDSPTAVHSFELDPTTCKALIDLRAAHTMLSVTDRDRWHIHCAGMAREVGMVPFYSGGRRHSDMSSLGPFIGEDVTLQPQPPVRVTTIPNAMAELGVDAVDLIKIDVEGWEVDVILGALLEENAHKIKAIMFEYGGAWLDSRRGNSSWTLAELVDYLSVVGTVATDTAPATGGYACFYVGRFDLYPLSPPAPRPPESDIEFNTNVACLRRDARIHSALLNSHRKHISHCLAGQGLWAGE